MPNRNLSFLLLNFLNYFWSANDFIFASWFTEVIYICSFSNYKIQCDWKNENLCGKDLQKKESLHSWKPLNNGFATKGTTPKLVVNDALGLYDVKIFKRD